jgi:hypothetical protein
MKLFRRVGERFQEVARQRFSDQHFESHLEDLLEKNPQLIGDLMIVGRQVKTARGERIDLVALDRTGDVVIVELKRGPAHREIVSQINSYLTTARKWRYDDLERILEGGISIERKLAKRFQEHYKVRDVPEFNKYQRGVIVAEEIDEETLDCLANLRSPIVAIEFSHFPGDEEYILMGVKSETTAPEVASLATKPARQRKEKLRDYDEFLVSVDARVRELLPKEMSGVKSTAGHWDREQNRRFHWGHTDVHVGVYVERTSAGDDLSVYFCNHRKEPSIITAISKNLKQIRTSLKLTDESINLKDPQCPLDESLGRIDRTSLFAQVDRSAERAAAFLRVLKPLLGESL